MDKAARGAEVQCLAEVERQLKGVEVHNLRKIGKLKEDEDANIERCRCAVFGGML